jgi:ABC-type glutathione transport system ATPase component
MFIIGTSGVGKSVTIKHLVGLLRVDAARSGSTAGASTS